MNIKVKGEDGKEVLKSIEELLNLQPSLSEMEQIRKKQETIQEAIDFLLIGGM